MKLAKLFCGVTAGLGVVVLSQAVAQRVQFATPAADTTAPPATTTAPLNTPSSPYGTGTTTSPYPTAPSSAMPSTSTAPSGVPLASPGTPTTPAPAAMTPAPGAAPMPGPAPTYTPQGPVASPPGAAVNGVIQAPPPTWDAYATPGTASGTMLSQDPLVPAGACGQFSTATMQKFIQHVDLDFDWLAGNPGPPGGNGQRELGVDDVSLSATFAFPMLFNSSTPLLVTPGFAVHYWSGPVSLPPVSPDFVAPADLPSRTYDAYLDFAWNPKVNEFFGGELNVRAAVCSDFYLVTSKSIRLTGKGMAVLRFSPSITVKAGVWYLDRVNVKALPAGGIVWTPNADVYFNILFPDPKIAKRLTTWGNTEWWLYGRGEYGGGVWTVRRNTEYYNGTDYPRYSADLVDYDDIRVAVGLEFKTLRQMTGDFEVGLACSRELNYRSGLPSSYYPSNTVFVGAHLSY
ncbi:MAG: hypothetical protein ABFC63_06915 [Thermoguttaceae bacterium]